MNALPHKYHNTPTVRDNITFHSLKESRRYQELCLLLHEHKIENLSLQPRFDIVVAGEFICKYYADFRYYDCETRQIVIEDVKGGAATRTQVYRLKKKLVEAIYNISITES